MSRSKFERELLSTIVHLLYRHMKLTAVFLSVVVATSVVLHFALPTYQASAVLYLRSANTSPILSAAAKITGFQLHNDYSNAPLNESYLKILNSQNLSAYIAETMRRNSERFGKLSPDLLDELGYESLPSATYPKDWIDFADDLMGLVRFKGKDLDLIEIASASRSPDTAVEVANLFNRIANAYLVDYESKEVSDIEQFMRSEVSATQSRIDQLSRELDIFKGQQYMLNMASGDGSNINRQALSRLEEEREMTQVRLQEFDTIIERITKDLEQQSGRTPAGEDFDTTDLRGRSVDKLRMLEEERNNLNAKGDALEIRIRAIKARVKPQFEQKIYEFTKKLETEHYLYQDLKKQLAELNVYRISVGNRVRSYTTAKVGSAAHETPISKKVMLSILIGTAFLFFVLYMWEQLHPVISSKFDLSAFDITYLGSIPTVGVRPSLLHRLTMMVATPFIPGAKHTSIAQGRNRDSVAFQFLRTRILNLLKRFPNQSQIIAIASPTPGDGKSFMCSNIAVILGKCKLKVLVIDCDVVKSSMSDYFNVDTMVGISDAVSNPKLDLEQAIIQSSSENVYFLASGSSKQAAEQFVGGNFKPTFERLKKKFDVILLDTPAALARPETFMLAQEADHLLLVLNAYNTKFSSLIEMMDGMGIEKGKPIYGVLNHHEELLRSAYYSYYVQAAKGA